VISVALQRVRLPRAPLVDKHYIALGSPFIDKSLAAAALASIYCRDSRTPFEEKNRIGRGFWHERGQDQNVERDLAPGFCFSILIDLIFAAPSFLVGSSRARVKLDLWGLLMTCGPARRRVGLASGAANSAADDYRRHYKPQGFIAVTSCYH